MDGGQKIDSLGTQPSITAYIAILQGLRGLDCTRKQLDGNGMHRGWAAPPILPNQNLYGLHAVWAWRAGPQGCR